MESEAPFQTDAPSLGVLNPVYIDHTIYLLHLNIFNVATSCYFRVCVFRIIDIKFSDRQANRLVGFISGANDCIFNIQDNIVWTIVDVSSDKIVARSVEYDGRYVRMSA